MSYDAVSGLSSFDIALQSIQKGGKVRRAKWPAGAYIERRGEALQKMNLPAALGDADLLADDWEEALVPT